MAVGLDFKLVCFVDGLLSVYLNVNRTVVIRLLNGILKQIEQNLLEPLQVTPHFNAILHDFKYYRDLFWVDRTDAFDYRPCSLLQIKLANFGL